MPIKRRKNMPVPKKRVKTPDDLPRSPGVPIERLVKEYDQRASDAHWEGDHEEGDRLQSIADNYRKRLEAGEVWEVDH
mgnify:CR=1 FL=1